MPDETVVEFPYGCMEARRLKRNEAPLSSVTSRIRAEVSPSGSCSRLQARDSKFRRVTCVRTFLSRIFWLSLSLSLSFFLSFSLLISPFLWASSRARAPAWLLFAIEARRRLHARPTIPDWRRATWPPEMEHSPASECSWLRFRALLLLTQPVNFPGRERRAKKPPQLLAPVGYPVRVPDENFFSLLVTDAWWQFSRGFSTNSILSRKRNWVQQTLPFNLLRWNDVPRTSRTLHPKNCHIFSVLSMRKYNPGEANNQFFTSQSFLSSEERISCRRVEKKRATNYCVRFGRSLRSAISCQRNVVNSRYTVGVKRRWKWARCFFLNRRRLMRVWRERKPDMSSSPSFKI